MVILAVGWALGHNPAYELLFFAKRVLLLVKDMAYRMSTGLVKPAMIAHTGNGQASGSAVGSILARTGLAGVAARMTEKKPIGLGNFDFSCYQNSIIQGLASLVSVPKFLDAMIAEDDSTTAPTSSVLKATIQALNTLQDRRMIMLPKALKSMSSIEQQDAQEYYSKVLDQIDKEMIATMKTSIDKPVNPVSEELQDATKMIEAEKQLQNPLEGSIAQRVGCLKCGHSDGMSLIPFNDLTLPLSPFSTCHISECLSEFTKLETIEGVECPKCTLLESESKLLRMKSMALPKKVVADVKRRLTAIRDALLKGDFSDKTLAQKCELPKKLWKSTTKSKQQAVGKPPTCLVMHVNRSVFDETTGALYKNNSNVTFPTTLDLGPWCIGNLDMEGIPEANDKTSHLPLPSSLADPRYSMLPPHSNYPSQKQQPSEWQYDLRAMVAHYGRHENGHYICYRKYPELLASAEQTGNQTKFGGWWELSDDDVRKISEEEVLGEGQVFMLFYELVTASMGEMEACLRIAMRVPLPADSDNDTEELNDLDQEGTGATGESDESSLISSRDTIAITNSSHQEAPTTLFPKMSTGINSTNVIDHNLNQTARIVDVL